MNEDEAWFAPKRFGYGGVPVDWKGWLLTILFVVIAVALCFMLRRRPIQLIPALILPTVIFLVISCQKTRGGCRWRWGEEE